jgi:hypothetical protein
MPDEPPARIPLRGGDEYDVLSRSRRIHVYAVQPGVAARVKRRYRRRFRRLVKLILRGHL